MICVNYNFIYWAERIVVSGLVAVVYSTIVFMTPIGMLIAFGAPLKPRIDSELANHLGFVDRSLAGREWLLGDTFSGADVQMSFVGEAARGLRASYPNLDGWVRRFQ